MAELLTQYLRETAGRRFAWGRDDAVAVDCYWWGLGWIARARGPEAVAPLRAKYMGRYHTGLGAMRHIRELGGWRGVYREIEEVTGILPTQDLARGDLVAIDDGVELAAGICVTPETEGGLPRVARLFAPAGLASVIAAPALAWRVA